MVVPFCDRNLKFLEKIRVENWQKVANAHRRVFFLLKTRFSQSWRAEIISVVAGCFVLDMDENLFIGRVVLLYSPTIFAILIVFINCQSVRNFNFI